ncbi:hypothetical protein BGZ58_005638, partial [Dissophora ornata]
MPRIPMCSVFDAEHCKLPFEERSVSHLHRYHSNKPVQFISQYNGRQITVYRDPNQGNYYPCPHHDCDHISILSSDPLSHHKSCPHFKLQYRRNEAPATSSTTSSAAPSATTSTSTVQQVVQDPPTSKRRRVTSGTDKPANQQMIPSVKPTPDPSDMEVDFRSVAMSMASLHGDMKSVLSVVKDMNSRLIGLETAFAVINSVDDNIVTLRDSITEVKADINNIDSTVVMVRHTQDDHDKTLRNLTEAVQIVSASNQEINMRINSDNYRHHQVKTFIRTSTP